MRRETGLKQHFGVNLAELLATKIEQVYPKFDHPTFIRDIDQSVFQLELVARTALIAKALREHLPDNYTKALKILLKIVGPENEKETGMFTTGYWLWPVAKFVELYGTDHFDESMEAIYEITKRHTGEYAIRPFVRKYPRESLRLIRRWAKDPNVHVRRLASESLRPRLPWAQKMTLFIDNPAPVFGVLELLKDDPSNFVQKSVANNINDYLKDNPKAALALLKQWKPDATPQRTWIIKHALRNEVKKMKTARG